jgi:hypothetical protein
MPKPKPTAPMARPSDDEPFVDLKVTVGNSLKMALSKLTISEPSSSLPADGVESENVEVGTECKHGGCQTKYLNSDTNLTDCQYHPGIPIFHEGYKFWSCCRKRTSDFNEFLRQEGCKFGSHLWKETEKVIRCDWHQTGSQVVISIFSKCSLPDECHFSANSTNVTAGITYYDNGKKATFNRTWKLEGVIDAKRSSVELLGSKAEIKLRKFDGTPWKHLEIKQAEQPQPLTTTNNTTN